MSMAYDKGEMTPDITWSSDKWSREVTRIIKSLN